MAEALRHDAITVNWQNGQIDGASASERLALNLMALAVKLTNYPNRPGFSKICGAIKSFLPSEKPVRVQYPDGTEYQFPYADPYWSCLCSPGFLYEQEIHFFLKRARDVDYTFVDCGANFGFWSLLVSGPRFGEKKAVAVEASSQSFGRAMRNSVLNDNRFSAHHRAIGDETGKKLTLYGGAKHEQRSVNVDEDVGPALETVTSIAIADLPEVKNATGKFVLKLDVEGMEITALRGAEPILELDTLVIFEDHGSDRQHTNAAMIMAEFGMHVFAGLPDGNFFEITDINQMTPYKTARRKGYDFFATRSEFWIGVLSAKR